MEGEGEGEGNEVEREVRCGWPGCQAVQVGRDRGNEVSFRMSTVRQLGDHVRSQHRCRWSMYQFFLGLEPRPTFCAGHGFNKCDTCGTLDECCSKHLCSLAKGVLLDRGCRDVVLPLGTQESMCSLEHDLTARGDAYASLGTSEEWEEALRRSMDWTCRDLAFWFIWQEYELSCEE